MGLTYAMFQSLSFSLFRMDREYNSHIPREALIVIGDIVREAEDLSEALYNARSKSSRRSKDLGILIERG